MTRDIQDQERTEEHEDRESMAFAIIAAALAPLDDKARDRVMRWVVDRYWQSGVTHP